MIPKQPLSLLFIFFTCLSCTKSNLVKMGPLKVGLATEWNSKLTPPLQHSAIAAAILSNEFEPLVSIGKGGQILPNLATSWKIKEGFKEIEFTIDTSKRFSDGSYLTAFDFKNAWEQGLEMQPRSSNSSLADALGYIKGIEDFSTRNKISGILVKNEKTLTISFSKPFRTVFTFLSSISLSVFKKGQNGPIGTGPYMIISNTGKEVILTKNRYFQGFVGFDKVKILSIAPQMGHQLLSTKKIDVLLYSEITDFECVTSKKIGCYTGLESSHNLININSLTGKFFHENRMRLALQAMVHEYLKKQAADYDPQVYLPLQAGRISNHDAEKIIRSGRQHIDLLRERSKKTPITLMASGDGKAVKQLEAVLNHFKIKFNKTKIAPFKELLNDYYKVHKFDLTLSGSSVHHGDPDGIYHKLGKNGAIAGSGLNRERTIPLLEEGRSILDPKKLHSHYQRVTKAILKDVPFVHTGFRSTTTAFNRSVTDLGDKFKERNDARLNKFFPKAK